MNNIFENEDIQTCILMLIAMNFKCKDKLKKKRSEGNLTEEEYRDIKYRFSEKINNILILTYMGALMQNAFENDVVILAMLDELDILGDIEDLE